MKESRESTPPSSFRRRAIYLDHCSERRLSGCTQATYTTPSPLPVDVPHRLGISLSAAAYRRGASLLVCAEKRHGCGERGMGGDVKIPSERRERDHWKAQERGEDSREKKRISTQADSKRFPWLPLDRILLEKKKPLGRRVQQGRGLGGEKESKEEDWVDRRRARKSTGWTEGKQEEGQGETELLLTLGIL